jgi:transcriptional regulator with XRE-family HTH domain
LNTKNVFGRQPAYDVVLGQGRTISGTARAIDVSLHHLSWALNGRVRPNYAVRERLPEFLGVPLSELFTPESLEPPHTGTGRLPTLEQAERRARRLRTLAQEAEREVKRLRLGAAS